MVYGMTLGAMAEDSNEDGDEPSSSGVKSRVCLHALCYLHIYHACPLGFLHRGRHQVVQNLGSSARSSST
jgi:hypothetical protein